MVKIRLTRQGAKKRPFYRIVAIDERKPRQGRALEFLGTVALSSAMSFREKLSFTFSVSFWIRTISDASTVLMPLSK